MQRCTDCSRHVRESESRCPFCSAPLRQVQGAAPGVIAALVGLALVACNGDEMNAETTMATSSGSSAGTDSMSSTNNVPTSTSEMTASTATVTSSSPTASSDPTATVTSDPTATATSDMTSTSTSGGTSTSSGSDSSSTGQTDTGTTQMTTGGDCTGPGEQICGGVCVNTLVDDHHCGKCFNVCDPNQGRFCNEGECVVITPYGAPMPDPLWV